MILLPFTIGGRLRLGARRPDGRLRPLADWQPNLILEAGLEEVAANSTWLDCCQVGTSATAPAPEQTALIEPLAGTANRVAANSAASGTAPWRGYSQITWRFAAGAVVGIVRELAFGSSAEVGSTPFSRALVKDVFGNPRGVRVLEDEALEVEYEPSIYAPPADITGEVLIDGESVVYTARAALASTPQHWAPYRAASYATAGQAVRAQFNTTAGAHIAAYSGNIGAATSSPGGTSANAGTITAAAYVPGSYQRIARVEWDPTVANFDGGIRSLCWRMAVGTGAGGNSLGAFQLQFAEPVMKTSDLSLRFDLGISWGRQ